MVAESAGSHRETGDTEPATCRGELYGRWDLDRNTTACDAPEPAARCVCELNVTPSAVDFAAASEDTG
jgi:hypothetical protein